MNVTEEQTSDEKIQQLKNFLHKPVPAPAQITIPRILAVTSLIMLGVICLYVVLLIEQLIPQKNVDDQYLRPILLSSTPTSTPERTKELFRAREEAVDAYQQKQQGYRDASKDLQVSTSTNSRKLKSPSVKL